MSSKDNPDLWRKCKYCRRPSKEKVCDYCLDDIELLSWDAENHCNYYTEDY